jgi:glycosyltransferase involved in cell wall biosynthesis
MTIAFKPLSPTFSVVLPTYKRLDLLRRAVHSVLAQTLDDWELIISDDEDPPGETWTYLQQLAADDARVQVIRNPGPHGQCGNVNSAMRQARGQWIKFLYDDDLLRPQCLEIFLEAVRDQPGVILASCNVAEFRNGRLHRSGENNGPLLILIHQRFVHLGFYLQEEVGGGVPSQVMVHRRVLEQGIWLEENPQFRSAVDSWWWMRILQHGDSLLVRVPLVEFYQGEHESITSMTDPAKLDEEFRELRRLQLPLIDPSLHPPSLPVVYQMLNLIRAVSRASRRDFVGAVQLSLRCWRPCAWWLALRWLLRRRFPDRFFTVQRIQLDDAGVRRALAKIEPISMPAPATWNTSET